MQITKIDLQNCLLFLKSGKWEMGAQDGINLVDTIMRIEGAVKSIEKMEAEKTEADKKPAGKKSKKEPTPAPAPEKKPEAKTK